MFSSFRRISRLAVIVPFAAMTLHASAASAQSPLGAASSFAALAGKVVTCTASTVTGNVGVAPGGVVVGCTPAPPGTVDLSAATAYNAFLDAYIALQAMPCGTTLLTGNLAGLTLPPGVYCVAAASTTTGGTLTLNGPASGIWIFKIGTGGGGALTGTNFTVAMAGGGSPCNVYWWVKDAATLTTSFLKGTILAGADITSTGSILKGAALAGGAGFPFFPAGVVTLTGSAVSVCNLGGNFPPVDKCEEHHDRDGDDHDNDRDHHDKDKDKDKDKNHKDKEKEGKGRRG